MTLTFLDGDAKTQIAWSRRREFQNLETRRLTANASGRETTPSPRWTLSASSPPVWTSRSSLTLPSWRRSMTPRPGSTLASSTNARCNFISAFSTEKFQRPNAQGFKGERTPLPFLGVGPLQVHLQHPLPSRWNFWFSEKLAGRFYTPAMLFASNDDSSVMIDRQHYSRCVWKTLSVCWILHQFLSTQSMLWPRKALPDKQSIFFAAQLFSYRYIIQDSEGYRIRRWPSFCRLLWLVKWQVRQNWITASKSGQ